MKQTKYLVVAIALLLLIAISACTSTPTGKITNQIIKIGFIGPLTGEAASFGQDMRNGVELALQESGRDNIKIIYEDTKLSNKEGVTVINKLIQIDGAKIIIGAEGSSVINAILPITNSNQALVISPSASADSLSQDDYFFRTLTRDSFKVDMIVDYVYNRLGKRKAAILFLNTDSTVGIKDRVIKEFERLGGKIVSSEGYELDETDFRTRLIKIKEKNPDVIFTSSYSEDFGTILKQAREIGISQQIVIPLEMAEDPSVKEIAGEAANGVYYVYPEERNNKQAKVFKEKYKEVFGKEPGAFSAESYDATILVIKMIEICGENTDCIKRELLKIKNYDGASGILSFDLNGDVEKPWSIKKIENQQFVVVK